MPNPEKLKTPELSEEEKVIKESTENVEDFKDELPITKDEAKDAGDALQEWYKVAEENPEEANEALKLYMDELVKVSRPIETLAKGFAKGMKNAIDKGNLKLSEEDMHNYHPEALLVKVFETAQKENINLVKKYEESGQYFVDPDGLFNVINKLEKKDRKFIKKALKAITKTRHQERKESYKLEEKMTKKASKEIINKIN